MSQTLLLLGLHMDRLGVPGDRVSDQIQHLLRRWAVVDRLNAPTPEQQTEIGRLFRAATNPPGGWDDLTPAAQQATIARAVVFVQTVLRMADQA